MDNISMSVEFMKIGFVLAIPIFIFGVVTYLIENKFIEWIFCFLKMFFYGSLAYFMWRYVQVNAMDEIGIVTAFTFIFSCIECGDNAVKTVGMIMKLIKNLRENSKTKI